jgi:hypothetical protein
MIAYTLAHHDQLSCLALSVVVGVLESLVEATPTRIGHTYLCSLQSTLHPKDWNGDDLPYFSFTALSSDNVHNLNLWTWLLRRNDGHRVLARRSGTLIPSMGDGSGTGTGGTVQYSNTTAPLEMWMGVWSPRVFHFSSNWKEMRTLLATLQRAKATHRSDIDGTTFFYFTDNIVVYFAVTSGSSTSPGLQAMVEQIKLLEIELGIILEVIHVPGTTIIEERTDGLSRGVWGSSLHQRYERKAIPSEIFAPVPFTPDLASWAINKIGLDPSLPCHHRCWDLEWRSADVFDRLTIWTPPPKIAAQLIYSLLQFYVEKPLTTAMIIVVPRILQRRWTRLSWHVVEIGCFQRHLVPVLYRSILTIPVVLLFIPFHVRQLQPPRLDLTPETPNRYLHRQHAESVRRVSEPSEPDGPSVDVPVL